MKKFGLRLMGCRKCYFLILTFFIFPNFMEKPSFLIMDFEGSYEVLLVHKYFWSTYFWQWNEGSFNFFFEISMEMHFDSLFFLNERNITASLLMIHLKCTVVHYANLNSSSLNKPYLRVVEYSILFFSIFYLCLF